MINNFNFPPGNLANFKFGARFSCLRVRRLSFVQWFLCAVLVFVCSKYHNLKDHKCLRYIQELTKSHPFCKFCTQPHFNRIKDNINVHKSTFETYQYFNRKSNKHILFEVFYQRSVQTFMTQNAIDLVPKLFDCFKKDLDQKLFHTLRVFAFTSAFVLGFWLIYQTLYLQRLVRLFFAW